MYEAKEVERLTPLISVDSEATRQVTSTWCPKTPGLPDDAAGLKDFVGNRLCCYGPCAITKCMHIYNGYPIKPYENYPKKTICLGKEINI